MISGRARISGKKHRLENRISRGVDNAIYLDLADDKWRAIRITSTGWAIDPKPPILFERYKHQKEQVEPSKTGNIMRIFSFIRIKDEESKLLFLTYIIACFVPDIPHPILIFNGSQGAAKSTLFKICRSIIDPSELELLSFTEDKKEFAQLLREHYCCYFDNVSSISSEASDTMCKVVFGTSFSKRKLYTDDESIIWKFRRCCGINGISITGIKPDLADRAIHLQLERIPPEERKNERELQEEFRKALPEILGGILDTLVKANSILDTVEIVKKPRMADYAQFGESVSRALGHTPGFFEKVYQQNTKHYNAEIISDSKIGELLCEMMGDKEKWEGTAAELRKNLMEFEVGKKEVGESSSISKTPQELMRELNKLKTSLQDQGIVFESKHDGKKRLLKISKMPEQKGA